MKPDKDKTTMSPVLSTMDAEIRCEYLVTTDIKRLWKAELEILAEIDLICRKHAIKYWVDYGSMLGAVRHHGFIPWDDDLDLGMLRCDYDKFKEVVQEELSEEYFFQSYETDPAYFVGNACVRKNGTTAIMRTFAATNGKMKYRFHQGVSVDILIFDNVPDDDSELGKFYLEVSCLRSRVAYLEFVKGTVRARDWKLLKTDWKMFLAAFYRAIRIGLCDFLTHKEYSRKMLSKSCVVAERYKHDLTRRVAPLTTMPYGEKELGIDKAIFDRMVYVDFENLKVPIPERYAERLAICYGEWKTPVKDVSQHKGMFFDIDKPYQCFFREKVFHD